MTVATILKTKGADVATARGDTSLHDIARQLDARGIGAIVIVGDADAVEGIISERDIVRSLARHGPDILDKPVQAHMTKDVITCGKDDLIDHVMEKMTRGKFRHIPVVENGRLSGIVSIGDVVKNKLAQAESETAMMRDYIAMT